MHRISLFTVVLSVVLRQQFCFSNYIRNTTQSDTCLWRNMWSKQIVQTDFRNGFPPEAERTEFWVDERWVLLSVQQGENMIHQFTQTMVSDTQTSTDVQLQQKYKKERTCVHKSDICAVILRCLECFALLLIYFSSRVHCEDATCRNTSVFIGKHILKYTKTDSTSEQFYNNMI